MFIMLVTSKLWCQLGVYTHVTEYVHIISPNLAMVSTSVTIGSCWWYIAAVSLVTVILRMGNCYYDVAWHYYCFDILAISFGELVFIV